MLAAALAWDGLSTELSSATADYSSALAAMTSGPWRGLASTSMASAAAPYIA
ncbi:PPE family protein [Mycobacterium ulcerans str. Harvey]|uniref:PPE family protein n=1 Tax=Mycobacterium ulcerans str. Harvey TaxID=1299332 RepID=A0ABP3AKG8_MYCUL|nr:PPE family protein [Mycobacterium ulcerans str. Harvey]